MTDKELLELAAKAAGIPLKADFAERYDYYMQDRLMWNPLFNDGDALRLAVKLNIHITISEYKRTVCRQGNDFRSLEDHGIDPYAATRRAIVRAAAQIGKTIAP